MTPTIPSQNHDDEPRAVRFDLDFDEFLGDLQDDDLDRCLFEIRESLDSHRHG